MIHDSLISFFQNFHFHEIVFFCCCCFCLSKHYRHQEVFVHFLQTHEVQVLSMTKLLDMLVFIDNIKFNTTNNNSINISTNKHVRFNTQMYIINSDIKVIRTTNTTNTTNIISTINLIVVEFNFLMNKVTIFIMAL